MARILYPPYYSPTGKQAGVGQAWIVHAYDVDIDATLEQVANYGSYAQLATASVAELISANAADTTQTAYVFGIDSSGNKASEAITLTGDTAVQGSTTFSYIENFYLSAEAAGNVTLRHSDDTAVNLIPAGSLSADVAQHFTGEAHSYLTQWGAELHGTTGQDDIQVELRWYPDDADCLDTGDGYAVLDRIALIYDRQANAATSDVRGRRVYKPALYLPPGGWLTVWAIAGAADMDVIVGMRGTDVFPAAS